MVKEEIKKRRKLNFIKRTFWIVVARLDKNSGVLNKIEAYLKERVSYFVHKWDVIKRAEKIPKELVAEIEKDKAKVIQLGTLYFMEVLKLIGGKTLNLGHGKAVKYYDDPQKWVVWNESALKTSLRLIHQEGLILKKGEKIIPPQNMEKAIVLLEKHGYDLAVFNEKIDEKKLSEKIRKGKIKPEDLKGIKREINQYFAVLTPNVEIREKINVVLEEY